MLQTISSSTTCFIEQDTQQATLRLTAKKRISFKDKAPVSSQGMNLVWIY